MAQEILEMDESSARACSDTFRPFFSVCKLLGAKGIKVKRDQVSIDNFGYFAWK